MRSNLAVAAALLALAGYVFVAAGAMPFGTIRVPQTAFFPKTLAILLLLLSLVLLAETVAGTKAQRDRDHIAADGWVRIGTTLAALAVFVFLLEPLGFIATAFLLMLALLRAIESHGWGKIVSVALITSLVSYALFAWLLGIPLPTGVLGP
jgi:putative tricarboxylic transport membrane protein